MTSIGGDGGSGGGDGGSDGGEKVVVVELEEDGEWCLLIWWLDELSVFQLHRPSLNQLNIAQACGSGGVAAWR